MLEELRKKSPSLKQAYAFWGAFLVTALIGVMWLIVLSVSLSENKTFTELEEGRQRVGAFAQFFGQVKENVSNAWQQNKEVINNLSTETGEGSVSGEEDGTGATTSTTTLNTSSTSSTILIATSSQKDIKIATTTDAISN